MLDDDANPSETPEIPEPAETDPVSPYSCLDSKKLHDAAIRALDFYLSPPPSKPKLADRRPSSIFIIAPNVDKETLLAHCCETLASAQRNSQRVGLQPHRPAMQHGVSHPADDFPGRVVGESGVGSG
ncbi:hypothetical protein AB7M22_003115 [Pseudomonas sp. ADAK2 TE3594]